jgi:hypothetical protein
VEEDQARMNQDLETGRGEAKAESEEELGGHAWCVDHRVAGAGASVHPQRADKRIPGSRIFGSQKPEFETERLSTPRRGRWRCRYLAPARRPLTGSTIPKVHVWTGREHALRSGAVGEERTPRGGRSEGEGSSELEPACSEGAVRAAL